MQVVKRFYVEHISSRDLSSRDLVSYPFLLNLPVHLKTHHCLVDCEFWFEVLGQRDERSLVSHLVTARNKEGLERTLL